MNRVLGCEFGYSVQPSNYTLWFCILKLLQNVPKHPRSHQNSQNHAFSLLGLTKQIFFAVPSPNMGKIPFFEPEYSIPNTRIQIGNLTTQFVESNSNPIIDYLSTPKNNWVHITVFPHVGKDEPIIESYQLYYSLKGFHRPSQEPDSDMYCKHLNFGLELKQ